MRVLVTGATGFIGSHLVPALVAAGHDVRALARGRRQARLPAGVEVRHASVTDPASLRAAVEGMDACVHLVAVIVERGEHGFQAVNHRGTQNLVEALAAAGVRRLIHQSALGAGPDERFPYLYSKWQGEEAVRAGGQDWTILRPSVVFGEGAGFFRPIVWTLRWMPVYPLPAGGHTRFQPIAVEDLSACIVKALEGTGSKQAIDIGGPEVMEFVDIVRAVTAALVKRRKLVGVPLWAARPFALVQGLRKEPLVTNGQLDMVVLDNTCDLDSVRGAFGFEPKRFTDSDLRWLARL